MVISLPYVFYMVISLHHVFYMVISLQYASYMIISLQHVERKELYGSTCSDEWTHQLIYLVKK